MDDNPFLGESKIQIQEKYMSICVFNGYTEGGNIVCEWVGSIEGPPRLHLTKIEIEMEYTNLDLGEGETR